MDNELLSIEKIAALPGMPSKRTIYHWRRALPRVLQSDGVPARVRRDKARFRSAPWARLSCSREQSFGPLLRIIAAGSKLMVVSAGPHNSINDGMSAAGHNRQTRPGTWGWFMSVVRPIATDLGGMIAPLPKAPGVRCGLGHCGDDRWRHSQKNFPPDGTSRSTSATKAGRNRCVPGAR